MKSFQIMFTGRVNGAIGIAHQIVELVKAENENDAINKLYDSYEHITVKYISEIEEKEII